MRKLLVTLLALMTVTPALAGTSFVNNTYTDDDVLWANGWTKLANLNYNLYWPLPFSQYCNPNTSTGYLHSSHPVYFGGKRHYRISPDRNPVTKKFEPDNDTVEQQKDWYVRKAYEAGCLVQCPTTGCILHERVVTQFEYCPRFRRAVLSIKDCGPNE